MVIWNKGKQLSEEHRRKISQSNKGRSSPMKGLRHTDEARYKMSIIKSGKKLSEEHCERISQGLKEYFSKVRFQRRSNALKEHYQNHEVWNKGKSWAMEIRERVRQGCLNSEIGMGQKPEPVHLREVVS